MLVQNVLDQTNSTGDLAQYLNEKPLIVNMGVAMLNKWFHTPTVRVELGDLLA